MTIEESINYTFKDKSLLDEALTHKSYANENEVKSNEKLEFLGDSILEFISSEYLFVNYKDLNEGTLTKARATVVCEDSLYEVAQKHKIYEFIKVGLSEEQHGGNLKKAILADSVEAIIAAIYFDGGLENAKKFIIDNLEDAMKDAHDTVGQKDYKSVLQEKLQEQGEVEIEYKIINEQGPDHDKTFTSEVIVNGKVLGIGSGKSKKHSEMEAARRVLEKK